MWPWSRRSEQRVQDTPIEPDPKKSVRPWMIPSSSAAEGQPSGFESITAHMKRWRRERRRDAVCISFAAVDTLGDGFTRTFPNIPAQTRFARTETGDPIVVISTNYRGLALEASACAWPASESFILDFTPDQGFRYAIAVAPHRT